MKNSSHTLSIVTIACFLIFGITSGLSAKEFGFYLHGGVTYWDGFDEPEFENGSDLSGFSIDYELDGSRAQLSLGVGLHTNETWSFEAFYVSTPEQTFTATDWTLPPIEPGGDPVIVSWNSSIKQTIGGVSAIYDLYVNENLSLFGKVGIAFVRHTSETNTSSSSHPDIRFSGLTPSTLTEEEDTQEVLGGIGARVPIRQGDASLTFTYQFIETDDDRETSFEIGFQWNL